MAFSYQKLFQSRPSISSLKAQDSKSTNQRINEKCVNSIKSLNQNVFPLPSILTYFNNITWRRIYKPVNHLIWSIFQKQLTAFTNVWLGLEQVPFIFMAFLVCHICKKGQDTSSRGILRTLSNIYLGTLLRKYLPAESKFSPKSYIIDVSQGSKYVSG